MQPRRLIVLRHAKSSWESDAPDDHSRPLNQRGEDDAPRVAEWLGNHGWSPDRVISSDSTRTRQTWARMQPHFPQASVDFRSEFYLAGVREFREAVEELDDDVTTLMVIGHNPGWEALVAWLCHEEHRMTTCNAALLEREASSWAESLEPGSWALERVVRPKEI